MSSEVVITEKQLPKDVIAAIRQGQKIEAIKLLRESTGLGLANAKVLVDRASRTHGPRKEVVSFADQPSGLSTVVKLLCLLGLAAGIWHYFQN